MPSAEITPLDVTVRSPSTWKERAPPPAPPSPLPHVLPPEPYVVGRIASPYSSLSQAVPPLLPQPAWPPPPPSTLATHGPASFAKPPPFAEILPLRNNEPPLTNCTVPVHVTVEPASMEREAPAEISPFDVDKAADSKRKLVERNMDLSDNTIVQADDNTVFVAIITKLFGNVTVPPET